MSGKSRKTMNNLKNGKTTNPKKITIWLLSTIAAIFVGIVINQLIANKPKIETHININDEKTIRNYKIEIQNAGDLSFRNAALSIDMYTHSTKNIEEISFGNIRVKHYCFNPADCYFKAIYKDQISFLKPILEIKCERVIPHQSICVSFDFPVFSDAIDIKMIADGFRYYGAFRNIYKAKYGEKIERHEKIYRE